MDAEILKRGTEIVRALKTDFGQRAQIQLVEVISQRLETALAPLMVGRLSGYGATEAKTVAKTVF